jgi:hypothetical protein
MKIKAIKDMWYIIDGEIKHNGKLEKGKTLETILEVKTFETEEEWKAELKTLGLDKESVEIKGPIDPYKINNNNNN